MLPAPPAPPCTRPSKFSRRVALPSPQTTTTSHQQLHACAHTQPAPSHTHIRPRLRRLRPEAYKSKCRWPLRGHDMSEASTSYEPYHNISQHSTIPNITKTNNRYHRYHRYQKTNQSPHNTSYSLIFTPLIISDMQYQRQAKTSPDKPRQANYKTRQA